MEITKLENKGVVIILDRDEAYLLRHSECMNEGFRKSDFGCLAGKDTLLKFMRELQQALNDAGIIA